jgi:hypothetical protein
MPLKRDVARHMIANQNQLLTGRSRDQDWANRPNARLQSFAPIFCPEPFALLGRPL